MFATLLEIFFESRMEPTTCPLKYHKRFVRFHGSSETFDHFVSCKTHFIALGFVAYSVKKFYAERKVAIKRQFHCHLTILLSVAILLLRQHQHGRLNDPGSLEA